MKLIIEVQGEDVAHASHYGLLELAGASDDKNTPLKLNEDALGFHDLRKEFVEIDRDQMFFGEDNPPKDTIRIELPFDTPARSVLTVSVRGKLQLKKIQTVDVQVPTTPGEVKDEQLAKAGVKLTIVKPEEENEFAYEVSGKLDNLFETQVIDGQGKPVETMGRSRFGGDESMHCNINLTKPCPRDAKLKLTLVTKAENVPVTFDLKDLKLP
jgi:hypothetical protein